jgi:hypothetical protein
MTKRKKSSPKYDMLIKAKGTSSRILEISQGSLRVETTSKGQASGKYYSGTHWDTVEATMQPDGTAQLAVKYIHMTNKGETVVGAGSCVQQPANSKGIAKFTGEGMMWTPSARLSKLNGGRWRCEGDYNMIKETVEVRGTFDMPASV